LKTFCALLDILEGKVCAGQTVHVDAKNGALEFPAELAKSHRGERLFIEFGA
jgi:hypothetical protein